MNRLPLLAGALAGLLLHATPRLAAAQATAATPALQQQIDALLKPRQRPEPLPIDPPNPFVVIQDGARSALVASRTMSIAKTPDEPRPAAQEPGPPIETSLASNIEILAATAARLKIRGVMERGEQMQIVVNDIPRREGDYIMMNWNNAAVALKVVRIQPGLLVLRYEDAEMLLKF